MHAASLNAACTYIKVDSLKLSVKLLFDRNRNLFSNCSIGADPRAGTTFNTGFLINCIVPVIFFYRFCGTDLPAGSADDAVVLYIKSHISLLMRQRRLKCFQNYPQLRAADHNGSGRTFHQDLAASGNVRADRPY